MTARDVKPFPSDPMRMWPISTRVNKADNDDAAILDPVEPDRQDADRWTAFAGIRLLLVRERVARLVNTATP